MATTRELFDWLVDGAPGAPSAPAVVAKMGADLVAGGLPVQRIAAFVRTLHPQFMGRSFVWEPDKEVVIQEASHQLLQSPMFKASPVAKVMATGEPIRRRLVDPTTPRDFPVLDELATQGTTDYLVSPLKFLSGQVHAIAFSTKHAAGFTDVQVADLLDLCRPLGRVAEILAFRRVAANLLDTYVGRHAGERILSGKILRGDSEMIRAAIWFSDLRGFTALASRTEPIALIGTLNELFDCQVPAIERHGGEVLKFMGDGLFAIFAHDGTTRSWAQVCDAAVDAASEAHTALAQLNGAREANGQDRIRFGLALHVGEITYGNIGSAARLDFTCIGPAVNVAARLEALTGKLDRPVVFSEEFAGHTTRASESVGAFELKGVPAPQTVFAPRTGGPLAAW